MARLCVSLPPFELRNPVLSASGTFGHGLEMQFISDPAAIGGLVSKTVTLAPRAGNPEPRICETVTRSTSCRQPITGWWYGCTWYISASVAWCSGRHGSSSPIAPGPGPRSGMVEF